MLRTFLSSYLVPDCDRSGLRVCSAPVLRSPAQGGLASYFATKLLRSPRCISADVGVASPLRVATAGGASSPSKPAAAARPAHLHNRESADRFTLVIMGSIQTLAKAALPGGLSPLATHFTTEGTLCTSPLWHSCFPLLLHDFSLVVTAGKMRSIEIFLNFMIMDANMNVLWKSPDTVPPDQADRMTAFWGDDSWRKAAYKTEPGLFGDLEEKASNEALVAAYRERLQNVAGFKYVPAPIPMRNTRGATIYYLFFASHNQTGNRIAESVFKKYRNHVAH